MEQFKVGQYEKALSIVQAYNSYADDDYRIKSWEIVLLNCLGRYDEAQLKFQKIINLNDNMPKVQNSVSA